MINDTTTLTGKVSLVLLDSSGKVKEQREIKNLVVTSGKDHTASRLVGTSSAAMSHMGVGTSSTAAAVGQTALVAEVTRVALSSATATGASVTHTATFGPGVGTGALQEAGIFNAASSGTMLARTVFAVINKGAGDTLQISWTVSVG